MLKRVNYMKIKIIYPKVINKKIIPFKNVKYSSLHIFFTAIICPIINIIVGEKLWNLIILIILYLGYGVIFYF